MTSDEIRERYLAFFEERGHRRIPSASLVPSAHDPSALFTVAGMHPLKPYFLGQETPPARAPDRLPEGLSHGRHRQRRQHRAAPDVLRDARQLLVRRLLQARGDRVRVGALARGASASPPSDIWVTVFEGDEELGLGPDEEAIDGWLGVGVPRERIVECPRSENFWQAGPTGPCGPCSELYLDRGVAVRVGRGPARAARTSASWSTGTSCSCSTTSSDGERLSAAAGAATSTRASASTAWPRSCRTSRRCSRPTSSRR